MGSVYSYLQVGLWTSTYECRRDKCCRFSPSLDLRWATTYFFTLSQVGIVRHNKPSFFLASWLCRTSYLPGTFVLPFTSFGLCLTSYNILRLIHFTGLIRLGIFIFC